MDSEMSTQNFKSESAEMSPEQPAPKHDINFAAALRAQYAIETPKTSRRFRQRKKAPVEEDEPLVDTTKVLPLHSKKIQRLRKRQQKREEKAAGQSESTTILDLPSELLSDLLAFLRPSDVFRLSQTCHLMREFVDEHENSVAKNIIRRRYWNLYRCFPLPIPLKDVSEEFHLGLLNERRLEMLNIHRTSYHQHIKMVNPYEVCTCMTCVFAWNNLCLILDLHHWQSNLENREPIPIIPRGSNPKWNQDLLNKHAEIVKTAMERPLHYACILEKHLSTICRTIIRFGRWKRKGAAPQPRLYRLTDSEAAAGTDVFLGRNGPTCYDFPFHRDNYYMVEAYVPNRRDGSDGKWHYYALPPTQHERDLEWVRSTIDSSASRERRAQQLANLKEHNIRWAQYLESRQQAEGK